MRFERYQQLALGDGAAFETKEGWKSCEVRFDVEVVAGEGKGIPRDSGSETGVERPMATRESRIMVLRSSITARAASFVVT